MNNNEIPWLIGASFLIVLAAVIAVANLAAGIGVAVLALALIHKKKQKAEVVREDAKAERLRVWGGF
jgi:hypothetical protein